jgi:hypothetical protein
MTLLQVVYEAIVDDKACFYYGGAVSFREYGNLHEMPVAPELAEFIKRGAVYWINEDKSEVRLQTGKQ